MTASRVCVHRGWGCALSHLLPAFALMAVAVAIHLVGGLARDPVPAAADGCPGPSPPASRLAPRDRAFRRPAAAPSDPGGSVGIALLVADRLGPQYRHLFLHHDLCHHRLRRRRAAAGMATRRGHAGADRRPHAGVVERHGLRRGHSTAQCPEVGPLGGPCRTEPRPLRPGTHSNARSGRCTAGNPPGAVTCLCHLAANQVSRTALPGRFP